jgi:hypothetical protein
VRTGALAGVVVALVVAFALAACGGDDNHDATVQRTVTVGTEPPPSTSTTEAPAQHQVIELDRGIAGVTLDMTPAEVKGVLGEPDDQTTEEGPFGPIERYDYPNNLEVAFTNDAVNSVISESRSAQTANGLGVGSTQAELEAGIPDLTCEDVGLQTLCRTGSPR